MNLPTVRVGWCPSNGTEGARFREANCDMCLHDHQTHMGIEGQGCPIVLWGMMTRLPVPMWEWKDGYAVCLVFQADGCS